jgi:hypothetical protein
MNRPDPRIDTGPASIDIDLPLDPNTDNGEDVARLVHEILDGIAAQTAGRDTSQQDILQALTIATALHAAVGEIGRSTGRLPALSIQGVEVASPTLN